MLGSDSGSCILYTIGNILFSSFDSNVNVSHKNLEYKEWKKNEKILNGNIIYILLLEFESTKKRSTSEIKGPRNVPKLGSLVSAGSKIVSYFSNMISKVLLLIEISLYIINLVLIIKLDIKCWTIFRFYPLS